MPSLSSILRQQYKIHQKLNLSSMHISAQYRTGWMKAVKRSLFWLPLYGYAYPPALQAALFDPNESRGIVRQGFPKILQSFIIVSSLHDHLAG